MQSERTGRPRPTLRTISEMTGLSLSTVSLSLRGGESLKEETRQKVAEAARAVGYVPNRAGVRLRTGKTNVLVLVLDGVDDSIDFARHMIQGIGAAIRGSRYHLTVMPEFDRHASVDTIRYILENGTADGVIITHTAPRDPRVQLLIDADMPFVSHGRTEFFTPHAWHDFHGEGFVEVAVAHLAGRGARSILLMLQDDGTMNYHNMARSFRQATRERGVEGRLSSERPEVHASRATLRDFGRAMAADPGRPEAIVCSGEMEAMALASGLRDAGLQIGQDLLILSKQTSDILPALFPEIDTIIEDVHAAGAELTRLLLARIAGTPAERLQTLSQPRLTPR